jgi:hypothetical protein
MAGREAVLVSRSTRRSAESYQDLADHLGIFLRKAKRRAERVAEIEAARVRLEGDDIPE